MHGSEEGRWKRAGKQYLAVDLSYKKADWREERRKQAWKLKEQGWPQQDIAVALGVSEGAVSQWMKRGREGGVEALESASAYRSKPTADSRAEGSNPGVVSQGSRELWISGRRVDGQTSDRGDRADLWRALPSRSRREVDA